MEVAGGCGWESKPFGIQSESILSIYLFYRYKDCSADLQPPATAPKPLSPKRLDPKPPATVLQLAATAATLCGVCVGCVRLFLGGKDFCRDGVFIPILR